MEDPSDQMSQSVAEALPLPGPDVPLSSPYNENMQQPLAYHHEIPNHHDTPPDAGHRDTPLDAPAVPPASYVPWGDTSANDFDDEEDGWSDHADLADMSQADAPAASKPNSFLEAACKGGTAEEVPIPASAVTTASVSTQGRSAGRGSAVLHEDSIAAPHVHAPQSRVQTARRPQTVVENGWQTVVSKKGSKSAKHVDGGGKDMHNAAKTAVTGGRLAPVRANPNTEQTDHNHDGHAETFTRSQRKRHARKRRKAQQQQHNPSASLILPFLCVLSELDIKFAFV